MSNLSELLPAGAGAKSTEFVASGTLGSGVTVALKTDGTVEAVGFSSSSVAENVGTETQFQNGNPEYTSAVFDVASGKVVIAYRDALNLSYGKAVVGTVSGDTISFGTPVTFLTATASFTVACYDPVAEKVVVFYTTGTTGYAIVGTVSGTSISFGSAVTFSTQNPAYTSSSFDTSAGKIVTAFAAQGGSNYATAIVGTVSGTSISFGSVVVFRSANTQEFACVYDTNANKTVILYRESSVTGAGEGIVGTVSGTSISFGTAVQFDSASVTVVRGAFDPDSNQIICAYTKATTKVVLGTVSGTSISFGAIVSAPTSDSSAYNGVCYDTNVNKIVLTYAYGGASPYANGTIATGTVSGTTLSFASPAATFNPTTVSEHIAAVYDSTNKKSVIAYGENNASGEALVFQAAGTATTSNYTDFIGITDEAIANTSTGAVIVQGGVITNTGLIPVAAVSFGTASSPASQGMYNTRMAYDSTSNKIVLAYEDQSNSNYGTAVIGTISGTTISWGTPVVFNSASTADGSIDVVYDPDQNKSVIVYRDIGNSGYGTAIVGTVSGTTISFGSEVVFSTRSSYYINATYDTAQDKVLIVFADGTAPSYAYTGYMVVGTVSGSSISFGSEVQFESSAISGTALALQYDASASKSLIVYAVSSANYAASITISGTTPSIGTKNNWASTSARNTEAVYIASSSKCVFAYSTTATDSPSFSAVATIDSGTGNVTVAASSSIVSATAQNERGLAYDIGAGSLVYVYNATNNYMSVVLGSISGDSVTWGEPTVLDSSGYASANFPATVYNSTEEKTVIAYRNATDSQSVVTNITAYTPLTTGSDYYVQANGTLSTTTSTVPAGRALSATSILLEG